MAFAAAIMLAASLAGCVQPRQDGALQPIRFAAIPGWSADTLADTLPAMKAECRRLASLPADAALGGTGTAAGLAGRAGQWRPACTAALAIAHGDAAGVRHFYESWFQPYRIDAPALVTGYYEPEVPGALAPSVGYRTPLLAKPRDLVQAAASPEGTAGQPGIGRWQDGRLVPYWTRAEIEAGKAGYAARPLLWLADPADLFVLQLQGAGRVRLPDGTVVRVTYDGKNGRPTTPVGRLLVAQGALSAQDVTAQSIRSWLLTHPAQAPAILDRNEDYVFFRVVTDNGEALGPPGALGVDLLAGRTAAIDRQQIPLGAPLFVDTTDPVTGDAWRRLLLAQDLGSDVVGAARVAVFLGAGALAEQRAGRMHQGGTDYVLLPRAAS